MRKYWQAAWGERPFRIALAVASATAIPIVVLLPVFFARIGAKPGWMPPDPVIAAIGPFDLTWVTFSVLYASIAFTVLRLVGDPWQFVRGLHAYAWVQVLRMISMAIVTFEPPPDIVPLIDPVTVVFYPGGVPFLKDLFFSGHTATMVLMVFLSRGNAARWSMMAATAMVGSFVVLQHVHWTVDVLAAPFFVWLAWLGSRLSLRLCGVATA